MLKDTLFKRQFKKNLYVLMNGVAILKTITNITYTRLKIDEAIYAVLDKSNYIMGEEINQLENQLENFTRAK